MVPARWVRIRSSAVQGLLDRAWGRVRSDCSWLGVVLGGTVCGDGGRRDAPRGLRPALRAPPPWPAVGGDRRLGHVRRGVGDLGSDGRQPAAAGGHEAGCLEPPGGGGRPRCRRPRVIPVRGFRAQGWWPPWRWCGALGWQPEVGSPERGEAEHRSAHPLGRWGTAGSECVGSRSVGSVLPGFHGSPTLEGYEEGRQGRIVVGVRVVGPAGGAFGCRVGPGRSRSSAQDGGRGRPRRGDHWEVIDETRFSSPKT